MLRDGCARKRRFAARLMFSSSATAIKYLRCLNSSKSDKLSRSAVGFVKPGNSFNAANESVFLRWDSYYEGRNQESQQYL